MNLCFETILWLNEQLDRIHLESIKYGELLLGAVNKVSIDLYTNKLSQLEHEHQQITKKIEKEKEYAKQNL